MTVRCVKVLSIPMTDHHALKARGVAFEDDLTDDFWGVWASFSDPDGNGWTLAQSLERRVATTIEALEARSIR